MIQKCREQTDTDMKGTITLLEYSSASYKIGRVLDICDLKDKRYIVCGFDIAADTADLNCEHEREAENLKGLALNLIF